MPSSTVVDCGHRLDTQLYFWAGGRLQFDKRVLAAERNLHNAVARLRSVRAERRKHEADFKAKGHDKFIQLIA